MCGECGSGKKAETESTAGEKADAGGTAAEAATEGKAATEAAYGHEIELYTTRQTGKRDKRQ